MAAWLAALPQFMGACGPLVRDCELFPLLRPLAQSNLVDTAPLVMDATLEWHTIQRLFWWHHTEVIEKA